MSNTRRQSQRHGIRKNPAELQYGSASPTVINNGQEYTFRKGDAGSIIDLTIASEILASKIENWRILEEITLSDHQYITFDVKIQKKGQTRMRRNRRKTWNVRKLERYKAARSSN